MDAILKAWVLLASGAFLWLMPPAFKLGKVPTLLSFQASIVCISVATVTAKNLIKPEKLIHKQELIEAELIDSELAWQLDQGEEQLRQQYLINSAVDSALSEPIEQDCRAQLQRNLEETDRLIDEMARRQNLDKKPESKSLPLLSNGSKKLMDYASKKDWMEPRTIAKNWGRNNGFNSKEVDSFCAELIKAGLAEKDQDGKWRIIPQSK